MDFHSDADSLFPFYPDAPYSEGEGEEGEEGDTEGIDSGKNKTYF